MPDNNLLHMFVLEDKPFNALSAVEPVDRFFKGHFKDLAKKPETCCFSPQEFSKFREAFDPAMLIQNRQVINTFLSDYNKLLASCDKTAIQLLVRDVRLKKEKHLKQKNLDLKRQKLPTQKDLSFENLTLEDLIVENPALEGMVEQLQQALRLAYMQFYLNYVESRQSAQVELIKQIVKYMSLLAPLNASEDRTIELILAEVLAAQDKKNKHFFKSLMQQMDLLGKGKTQAIKKFLSKIGDLRSDVVWSSCFLNAILSTLPDDFYDKTVSEYILGLPGPIPSYLSWTIRYTRLFLNLMLFLKHVIPHPWMRPEERAIKAWERFKAQWQQRKFNLLTDTLWAVGNLCCQLWLTGNIGNAVIALLICIEFRNTWMEWKEAQFIQEGIIRDLSLRIKMVREAKIFCAKELQALKKIIAQEGHTKALDERMMELEKQIERLTQNIRNLSLELALRKRTWKYQRLRYIQGAISVMLGLTACVLMALYFLTPLAASSLILGVGGATLSFALTAFSNVVSLGIDRAELTATIKDLRAQFHTLVHKEQALSLATLHQLKALFITVLEQQVEAQWKMEQQYRAVAIYLIVPTVALAAMVFFPLHLCIALVAASITLAKCSDYLIRHRHKLQENHIKVTKEGIEEKLKDEHNVPKRWKNEPKEVFGFFAAIDARKETPDLTKPLALSWAKL